jgi:hypothetical protein
MTIFRTNVPECDDFLIRSFIDLEALKIWISGTDSIATYIRAANIQATK